MPPIRRRVKDLEALISRRQAEYNELLERHIKLQLENKELRKQLNNRAAGSTKEPKRSRKAGGNA